MSCARPDLCNNDMIKAANVSNIKGNKFQLINQKMLRDDGEHLVLDCQLHRICSAVDHTVMTAGHSREE